MKLSIIMDRYINPHAGTEGQVIKLVQGLLEKGWEVRFAVLRGSDYTRSGQFPVAVDELGIGSISNPANWLRTFQYGRQLKSEGFSLAHCFFNDASVICPPMMRLAGLPAIISRRDMGFWYTADYKRILRLTGRFVRAAVCNSQAVAEVTQKAENLPARKVHVIYNGYPDVVVPDEEVSDSRAFSSTKRCLVIGIVANLRPIKRIEDLIRALGLLVAAGYKLELRVVGAGEKAPYEALVTELNLQNCVNFIGGKADPDLFIRDFDIAVLCSESEGFSNAIIEYMRCGKPVVCTRTGGNPEIVTDGENGYLVPVGDVQELANKLEVLIEQPELREKMGRDGAAKVREHYSLETMLSQHVVLYQSIAPEVRQA
ncbi:MAG: glycosyltransferase [Marinobacter adhaerens]|uniref:Glycosyltransferase n=1 Tax=Marinobacter adhaerens TaxID=1033846 RepID=A0A844HUJ7_9GAMM|nr:glycosyltransferase [Marinobacter adhaerens]